MAKSLRLGVAGLGTVGTGVLDILGKHAGLVAARAGMAVEITAVSARDRKKNRGHDLSRLAWHDDPVKLAAAPEIDVFVELMGGEGDPAKAAQLDSRGDISDPVGGTIEDYENAAERITTALRERLPEVLP